MTHIEARISRAKVCLENATDPQDQRYWSRELLEAINERNALRTPEQVEQIERERGLR